MVPDLDGQFAFQNVDRFVELPMHLGGQFNAGRDNQLNGFKCSTGLIAVGLESKRSAQRLERFAFAG